MIAYIKTENNITIMLDGEPPVTVYSTDPLFDQVVEAVKEKDVDQIRLLTKPADAIETYSLGRITVKDGEIYYDDTAIHNSVTERILRMLGEGFDVDPMIRFLDNLMDNPSKRAVDELYGFLEYGRLPITEDGHFLAYKNVREDFKDIHSGKFDNSPGSVCEMPRNMVDEDKNRTCSAGLHFCSKEYLASFPGRTVVLKINPRDVVAIPADYNNTKGRTCRYEVISTLADLNRDITDVNVWTQPIDEDDASRFDEEDELDLDFDDGYCGCGACDCDDDELSEEYTAAYQRGYKDGRGKKAREFFGKPEEWDDGSEEQGYCVGYQDGRQHVAPEF